ncbi:hypothetical protein RAH32_13685 [Paracoccus sp. WLY502]|uniref:hypothetical protein n=1 Tax=Paracoccus yibinensis TaxID=3068891 RepID=UPI002796A55C|nr:hypothetical protein [Paracoccus sp. WLY502]MDQ1901497.1 hypothetical protein [Paracoccus sp. WLY502]
MAQGVRLSEGARDSITRGNGGAICNVAMLETPQGAIVVDTGGTIAAQRVGAQALTDGRTGPSGSWMKGTAPQPATAAMKGGDLTLGGRVLTVMALSGHTRADLALIDQRTGTLIAGNLLFWTARPAFPMPISRHGGRRLAPLGR